MRQHSNPAYQALIEQVEDLSSNLEEESLFLQKVKELEDIADKQHDKILKTIAVFHKSDIPYRNLDFSKAQTYVIEALHIAQEIDFPFYLMRCYNSLAVIDSQVADYYSSISNYLKAFNIANMHPDYQFGCYLLNNIGNLFVWLDEHQIALDYLLQSYQKFQEEKINSDVTYATIMLNIVEEYSLLGEYEKAAHWASSNETTLEEAQKIINNMLTINQIDMNYKNACYDHISDLFDEVIAQSDEKDNFIYAFRCYLRLLNYTIREKDRLNANKVFKRTEHMKSQSSIKTFDYDYAVLKVQYYDAFQASEDDGSLAKTVLNEYVSNSTLIVKQMKNTYTRRLLMETELMKLTNEKDDALSKSRQLQKDIELDFFTKILNKISLEKYINQAIKFKQEDGTQQAFLILDIDHFKYVNDTYGHERGDELILKVVNTISSCCNNHMLFGRFGGDEFILFINNIRYIEYIKNFAEELLAKSRMIIIDEQAYITLSIGIYTLHAEDDFKSAFQKADVALYEAKREGRNRYALHTE